MKMLPILTLLLAGCVTTAQSVRLESSLLDTLQSNTEVREETNYTERVTRWRGSGGAFPEACLVVQSLGNQYASSGWVFPDTPEFSLDAGMRHRNSRGELPASTVVEEAETVNNYGTASYRRLSGSGNECVYSLQYTGDTSRYRSTGFLGDTRIEAWYCDATVSAALAKDFVEGIR